MSSDVAREASNNRSLHCGLAAPASNATLKSLEIRNVDFREHGLYAIQANDHFQRRTYTGPPSLHVYPQLTRLTVFRCPFSLFEADLQILPDRSVVGRHLSCVLHQTLVGGPELRYHKVISWCRRDCTNGFDLLKPNPARPAVSRQSRRRVHLQEPNQVFGIAAQAYEPPTAKLRDSRRPPL